MVSRISFDTTFTFDDVLIKPHYSEVTPDKVNITTNITKNIKLNIPLISAAMDTVTESKLAIAMAQNGGIGCIHKNLSPIEQASEVRKVKKFEAGIVFNPIIISKDKTIKDAMNIRKNFGISTILVVENDNSTKLAGILTNRDLRFVKESDGQIAEFMTKENLVTAKKNISLIDAEILLNRYKIEKLIIVDDENNCIGLITAKDIQKSKEFPDACKDEKGRLRVAAAVGIGKKEMKRVELLAKEDVDLIIIDTAHGHSYNVIQMVTEVKKNFPNLDVIAGNIATGEAAQALIDAGVDGVKVGIGPGSICTTRIVAGIGVPQLSAVVDVYRICKEHGIPLIADGGIRYSGDFAKAIAAGASVAMMGSLFAGTEESPGEVILYKGRSYKAYRGMGSISAMKLGSADRYFQQDVDNKMKLVPEGVEGRVPYKGSISPIIYQLCGGLRASMGYTGNKNIKEMNENCEFIRITNSSLKESHAHDITITSESPNYRTSDDNN